MESPVRGSLTLGGWGAARRRKALEGGQPLADRPGVLHLDQPVGELLLEDDGRIRRGVGAHGDAVLDLTRGDLARDHRRRLQAGAARLLDGDAGRRAGELGAEHGLARQVPILGMRHHGPAQRLVDVHALEVVLVDEPVEGAGQHVEVRLVGIERVGAAEGNAHAADHRHAP
jgi:hypothetical protein